MRYILFLCSVVLVAVSIRGAAEETAPEAAPLTELATADATRGWEAVGRIDMGRGSFCTGALISPQLVLTAAHCLFDNRTGERISVDGIEFRAGWRNGRAEAYRGVRRAVTHPDYEFGAPRQTSRVAKDLALLELDQPIRSGRITPFETSFDLKKGTEVGIVSYAEHRSEAPSLQEVCHVLERFRGVVMVSCSVDFGSSGAPIFQISDGVARIVSVVSSKAEARGEPVALAGELRPSLGRLKEALDAAPDTIFSGGNAMRSGGNTSRLGAKFVKP